MEPGSACLLASFNLAEYVDDSVHRFKLKEFAKDVRTVVVFMEKLQEESIDLLPLQIQKDQAERWKRIGIGIMGLADALIKMRVRYGSPDSLRICDKIGNVMAHEALIASEKYGLEHGSFIGFDETKVNNSDYVKRHVQHVSALRNGSLLTIAPTGTLSTMLGVSGGIEPLFDTIYTRKTESLDGEDKYYHINAPIVQKYMDENGMCGIDELPDFFITAKQVPWKERIAMQSVWQQHIDQAISSTVNLPEHISVNETGLLYEEAWRKGLKGITVYRDNCRRVGILTSEPQKTESKDDKIAECVKHVELKPVETPSDPIGKKRKLTTGCVDCETEYFNGTEWKKISEYTEGENVLQYNPDGTANLVKPLRYIKRKSEKNYHILTKHGLDMVISHDHRNVLFNTGSGRYKVLTTDELIKRHNSTKHGEYRKFKLSFDYSGDGIELSDDEIRLSIAVFADGSFHGTKLIGDKCQISVCKQRKADRLTEILTRLELEYDKTVNDRGYHVFRFYPPLQKTKHFPKEWYNCNKHQMEVIFDEVFHWDGNSVEHNEYSTIFKEDADFVQFVCASLGYRGSLYTDDRCNKHDERSNHSICYRVDHSDRSFAGVVRGKEKTKISEYCGGDGFDYCFTVPSSMLVLRRNDRIFVTGNCGSLHCIAFFDKDSGQLMEVYLGKGSQGGCQNYMIGLARMLSLAARSGIDIYDIVDQLNSSGTCPSYATRRATHKDTSKGSCCPVAIGNALVDMYQEMQAEIDRGMYWDYISDDDEDEELFSDVKEVIKIQLPEEVQPFDPSIYSVMKYHQMPIQPLETERGPVADPKKKDDRPNAGMVCPECHRVIPVKTGGCWSCPSCGWSKCN